MSKVDPALEAVTGTVPRISLDPIRVAAGAGAVWVADAENETVVRIDPSTSRVVRTIPLGGLPTALAAGPTGVWVAVDAA